MDCPKHVMDMTAVPNAKLVEDRRELPSQSGNSPAAESPPDTVYDPRKHRQHLEQLAELGVRSGSIAHEIKNALVGVKMFVDLLARQHPQAELAEVASREVARIQRLVADMLQVAQAPKRAIGALSLHAVLEETIALVQAPLRAKSIRLQTAFHRGRDVVQGNFDELKQAFLNVLLNAIEASDDGGPVEVRTWKGQGGTVGVGILDFGAGIRTEHLQRLFEPFFTTKASGSGLGLSITKRIISEHRGTIEVSSMPTEGTTFTIHLPLHGS